MLSKIKLLITGFILAMTTQAFAQDFLLRADGTKISISQPEVLRQKVQAALLKYLKSSGLTKAKPSDAEYRVYLNDLLTETNQLEVDVLAGILLEANAFRAHPPVTKAGSFESRDPERAAMAVQHVVTRLKLSPTYLNKPATPAPNAERVKKEEINKDYVLKADRTKIHLTPEDFTKARAALNKFSLANGYNENDAAAADALVFMSLFVNESDDLPPSQLAALLVDINGFRGMVAKAPKGAVSPKDSARADSIANKIVLRLGLHEWHLNPIAPPAKVKEADEPTEEDYERAADEANKLIDEFNSKPRK